MSMDTFAGKMAMALLLRWKQANDDLCSEFGLELWQDEEKKILYPYAQELYDDFLRQIEIEIEEDEKEEPECPCCR